MSKTLDTNLNVSPYFDDYDVDSQHHRVLFKPSVPIQARELTQLQSILQNQIEKFGDVVVKEGSIVEGCSFNIRNTEYIKLLDRNTSAELYTISEFANGFVQHASSNLIMQTVDSAAGFEITNPDLNTLYGRYVNSGNSGGTDKLSFVAGETVKFYPSNGQISNTFTIVDGGAAYTNGDTLIFTATRGINASANLTTNSTGGITAVSLIKAGQDFKINDVPIITFDTAGGTGANVTCTINSTASFEIAGLGFAVSGNTEFDPVGKTKRVNVSDGTIYQKGHFVEVNQQGVNVLRYNSSPNNMSIGFITSESIINSSSNTSLLDNSSGFNNENAPGADRLKLTPTLISKTKAEGNSSNNFLALIKFENGESVTLKEETQFSEIGEELAKRTYEESGDYVVKPFSFHTEDDTGNTTFDTIVIGAGKAFVKGFRNETIGASRTQIRKGTTTANVENATISQNYGNYIIVDEYLGSFDFNTGAAVKLLDTAGNRISTCPAGSAETVPSTNTATLVTASAPTYSGTIVGNARVRSVVYEDGVAGKEDGQYRLYLFDIVMNQGKNFADTRAVSYFTGADAGVGFADVVLTNDRAVLKDTNLRKFVVPTGIKGIKTFNHKTLAESSYTYRTISTGAAATNGTIVITLTGNQIFDYTGGGTLSTDQEKDFVIVANNTSAQTAALTGTVTTTTSNVVTGSSTTFTTDFQVGDTLRVTGSEDEVITGITNSTHLTTRAAFSTAVSGAAYRRLYVADKPIHLDDVSGSTGSNVTISTDQKSATINMSRGKTLESTFNLHISHNVTKRQSAQKNKLLSANTYVKLDCSTNADTSIGPWSLGAPDILNLQKVYVKYGNFTSIEAAANDKTEHFELLPNQRDGFYDLSKLKLRTDTIGAPTINSTARILAVFNHFVESGSGFGYATVDSYPVDDDTSTLPANKIRTERIPVYTSPQDGQSIDLRDAVDFRPYAANTANTTNALTAGAASTNPVKTVSFSGEQYLAAPGKSMSVDYEHYLPRIDKLMMDTQGVFSTTEGSSNLRPVPPQDSATAMTVGLLTVPVFPSLASLPAARAGRPDYAYQNLSKQQRNFTMKDIGQIKNEVRKIQYYTSLNLLEKQAIDLTIPSSANASLERFKNGILVDNFVDQTTADIGNREFKAGYDKVNSILTSRQKNNVIDITPNSYSNTVQTGDLITLTYDAVAEYDQRSATRTRNLAELFWNYSGIVNVFPNYDNFHDIRHPPSNDFHVELDLTQGTRSLLNSIRDLEAIQEPRNEVIGDTSATNFLGSTQSQTVNQVRSPAPGGSTTRNDTTTTTVNNFETIRTIRRQQSENQFQTQDIVNTQTVGEFVRDISFNPFIREQLLYLHAFGLKPNTRHYVYFDSKAVSTQSQPATVNVGDAINESNFRTTGAVGDAIRSNESGEVFAIFHLPAETHPVGERQVNISDQATVAAAFDTGSQAGGVFNAYNFGIDKSSIQLTTRQLGVTRSRVVTGETVETQATRSRRTETNTIPGPGNFVANPPAAAVPPAIVTTPPPAAAPEDDGDGDGGGDGDPLAQTFIVKNTNTTTGQFITKMDIFFESKDPVLGVLLQIRTVENGFPSTHIMPNGEVHLRSAQVNTSSDGSTATTFTFPAPVFLRSGLEYCFVLKPDANNPNYNIFVRKTGDTDIETNTIINQDNFEGLMFLSTNNRAWRPYQQEDVKFTIYRAKFNASTGSVDYQNADHEFFTLESVNGTFEQGERAFVYNNAANITGNVAFSTTSETVTGTGSTFTSDLAVGNFVAITNGTVHSVREVTAITNNTILTVRGFPDFASSQADIQLTPTGEIFYYESTNQIREMHLIGSTATNATFKFANTNSIVGSESGANATITEVENINMTAFDNMIYQITPADTALTQFHQSNTATGQTANTQFPINNRNRLTEVAKIKSKSNEIVDGTGKSLKHTFLFNSSKSHLSPVLDDGISNILRVENIINGSNTNEHLPLTGSATAKYLSKSVTLDEGLDAEDLRVFITATKPGSSDVEIYARVSNELEVDDFEDRHWTRLQLEGFNKQSAPGSIDDFAEYEYRIPDSPPATLLVGKALADNANALIATTDDQSSAVAVGDLLKIVNTSGSIDYQIETILAVNSTVITVGNDISFDNTQADILKVDTPQTAFKDPQNEFIATYYNSGQNKFDTFKNFQIKIVMLSNNAALAPRVRDFRALALSI